MQDRKSSSQEPSTTSTAATESTVSIPQNGIPFGLTDTFARRHIGPRESEMQAMLQLLGYKSLAEMTDAAVPANIRLPKPLNLPAPRSEF